MHTRRRLLTLVAAIVGISLAGGASVALAQAKLKVAAVYTVPVEQQWVSRIHKALNAAKDRGEIEYVFSEKVANADYERVMREFAEKGNTLIVGESFAVEAAARKVAKDYPKVSFLMGSSGKPQAPNFAVFDNYIQEPAYLTGMIAGGMTKTNKIGMVGGYPIPEVNRLMHAFMAGAQGSQSEGRVHGDVHRLVVRSAEGQGSGVRDDREGRRRACTPSASACPTRRRRRGKLAIGNVIDTQARVSGHRRRLGAVEHGADDRPRDQGGEGRHVQGRGLRPVFADEEQGLGAGAARHVRREGPDGPAGRR